MFEIDFYTNDKDPSYVDKSNGITIRLTLLGTLKNSTSIINPIIIIEFDGINSIFVVDDDNKMVVDDDNNNVSETYRMYNFVSFNYAYIKEFGRYYYIVDIISVRNNVWEIHMTCDVLMSFKNEILGLNSIIARNQADYDPMLVDNLIECKYDYDYEYVEVAGFACNNTIPYVEGGSLTVQHSYRKFNDDTMYAICVLDATSSRSSSRYGVNSNMSNIYILDHYSYSTVVLTLTSPDYLASLITLFESKAKNILYTAVVPYNRDMLSTFAMEEVNKIDVGVGSISLNEDDVAYKYREGECRVDCLTFCQDFTYYHDRPDNSIFTPIRIEPYFYNFMDYSPYTTIEMFLPYLGYVELDPHLIIGKDFYIIYVISPLTLECEILLSYEPIYPDKGVTDMTVVDGINVVQSWKTTIGTTLPFGESGINEMMKSLTGAALSIATKGATSAISRSGDIEKASMIKKRRKKGDAFRSRLLLQDVKTNKNVSDMTTLGDTLSSLLGSTPQSHISSQGNSSTSMAISNTVSFRIRRVKTNIPSMYNDMYGRPLLQKRKLRDVHGFTVVDSLRMYNFTKATIDEIEEIEELLKSGVILP